MIRLHDESPRLTRDGLELANIEREGVDDGEPKYAVTLSCPTADVTIHNVNRSHLIGFTEAECYDLALWKVM